MSAIPQPPRSVPLNRRRRVRQKVHAPAYATFTGSAKNGMLDLYEVLDISEVGAALQCPSPMKLNQQVELCLDLAEASGQISTPARVVWSDSAGRVGLGFQALPDSTLLRLREWLFLNAMAGAANAATYDAPPLPAHSLLRPNYTDTLSAASAVQREVESLGSNLEVILSLVVSRSRSLVRASGAAIALAGKNSKPTEVETDSGIMICRASSGQSSPPVGATLQVGSGFSGECVRTAAVSRCDDSHTDDRVDRQSCRALGIRSILAVPVILREKVIGLLEVFSAEANAFHENDATVLQRFAETIAAAVERSARPADSFIPPPAPGNFSPSPGSVLFASLAQGESGEIAEKLDQKNKTGNDQENAEPDTAASDKEKLAGIHLPRTHLYLLITAAATVALALGFLLAPWIQEKVHARSQNGEHTVLASSQPESDAPKSASLGSSVDSNNLEQLREQARQGNPTAENALGLLYAQGDEKRSIQLDEVEAARWFTKAAEHGSVPAQYKLGLLYWGGHGVPKDANKAYFWAVLARAGGQEGSKDLAKVLANGMTRAQAAAIEQQAEIWYQQQASMTKPKPGH